MGPRITAAPEHVTSAAAAAFDSLPEFLGPDAEWCSGLTDAEAAVFEPFPMTVVPAFERPVPLRLIDGGAAAGSRAGQSRSIGGGRAWALAVRSGHPSVAGGAAPRLVGPAPDRAATPGAARRQSGWHRGVRLTRRGRLVIVVAFAIVLTAAAFFVGRVASYAASGSSGTSPAGYPTVVVQPGDTLWSIASHAAPHADPRVTVQRIIDLNALHGADLQPGQQLALPS